jgi:hypothetical protein
MKKNNMLIYSTFVLAGFDFLINGLRVYRRIVTHFQHAPFFSVLMQDTVNYSLYFRDEQYVTAPLSGMQSLVRR